jgi:hypothetical protein
VQNEIYNSGKNTKASLRIRLTLWRPIRAFLNNKPLSLESSPVEIIYYESIV